MRRKRTLFLKFFPIEFFNLAEMKRLPLPLVANCMQSDVCINLHNAISMLWPFGHHDAIVTCSDVIIHVTYCQNIDICAYYITFKFPCHCINILEVQRRGGGFCCRIVYMSFVLKRSTIRALRIGQRNNSGVFYSQKRNTTQDSCSVPCYTLF